MTKSIRSLIFAMLALTLVLAACLQDSAVPLLHMRRLQLLQLDGAEVGPDLLLYELAVSLGCFGQ